MGSFRRGVRWIPRRPWRFREESNFRRRCGLASGSPYTAHKWARRDIDIAPESPEGAILGRPYGGACRDYDVLTARDCYRRCSLKAGDPYAAHLRLWGASAISAKRSIYGRTCGVARTGCGVWQAGNCYRICGSEPGAPYNSLYWGRVALGR